MKQKQVKNSLIPISKNEAKLISYLKKLQASKFVFINQNEISDILELLDRLRKENYCFKNKCGIKRCEICGEEFLVKRSTARYCKQCAPLARKYYNQQYLKNLSPEDRLKRNERVKKNMRKLRSQKKECGEND